MNDYRKNRDDYSCWDQRGSPGEYFETSSGGVELETFELIVGVTE